MIDDIAAFERRTVHTAAVPTAVPAARRAGSRGRAATVQLRMGNEPVHRGQRRGAQAQRTKRLPSGQSSHQCWLQEVCSLDQNKKYGMP